MMVGTALAAGVALVPYRPVLVSGASMNPTLHSGQLLMMQRSADVRRGDVVVVHHDGETLIKRVALIAGDTYWMARNRFGTVLPVDNVRSLSAAHHAGMELIPVTIPDGEIFLLADNPLMENDSRTFGPVPISDVEGTVLTPSKPEVAAQFPEAHLVSSALVQKES